jgi:hypothetical protein
MTPQPGHAETTTAAEDYAEAVRTAKRGTNMVSGMVATIWGWDGPEGTGWWKPGDRWNGFPNIVVPPEDAPRIFAELWASDLDQYGGPTGFWEDARRDLMERVAADGSLDLGWKYATWAEAAELEAEREGERLPEARR